jgi:hypothetical protein
MLALVAASMLAASPAQPNWTSAVHVGVAAAGTAGIYLLERHLLDVPKEASIWNAALGMSLAIVLWEVASARANGWRWGDAGFDTGGGFIGLGVGLSVSFLDRGCIVFAGARLCPGDGK